MVEEWALRCFGERADEVAARIVLALDDAHRTGRRTQRASGLAQRYAYGSTWISRFDRLEEYLGGLDGAEVEAVPRTPYRLVRLDGRLLVPFRLSHGLASVPTSPRLAGDVLRMLATRDVPEPLTLFDLDERPPRRVRADAVAPVLVGVVCRADDHDLQAVFWGLADTVDDQGVMTWRPQRLPLPHHVAGLPSPRAPVIPRGSASPAGSARRRGPPG